MNSVTTATFPIGTLSQQTGCKIPTIRYYEDIGLLPPPLRTEGNQRRYQEKHTSLLRFICHARELGFGLDAVRDLLSLSTEHASWQPSHSGQTESEQDPHAADSIVKRHLVDIKHKIKRLNALKRELESMVDLCNSGQSGGCRVVEVLSNHALCKHEH